MPAGGLVEFKSSRVTNPSTSIFGALPRDTGIVELVTFSFLVVSRLFAVNCTVIFSFFLFLLYYVIEFLVFLGSNFAGCLCFVPCSLLLQLFGVPLFFFRLNAYTI